MGGLSDRRKFRKPASRLCSREVVVNGLRFFWVITVIWCEAGTFFFSLRSCRWPDIKPFEHGEKPARLLLITDPQVRRPSGMHGRTLRQYFYDLNLRKSWNVVNRLKPHGVVFLGDMLASGKHVTNSTEYRSYHQHFKNTFTLDPAINVWYLPGNNDVGLGIPRARSRMVRRHFTDNFSPLNFKVSVKNNILLFLDAPGLVEEDYQRTAQGKQYKDWDPLPGGAVDFVKENAAGQNRKPVILFSHIPLGRPDTKSCGPLRERGTIRRGVGTGYQNTLGKETTTFLLETLRPSAVFSGDNRDYCDYTHVFHPSESDGGYEQTVREVTVKSFSPAKQIRRPGFQLLSLVSPPAHPSHALQTFADRPCLLPDQYSIYNSVYGSFLILTVIILFFSNMYRARQQRPSPPTPITISPVEGRQNGSVLSPQPVVWSPYAPWSPQAIPRSTSPHSAIPPSLRTSNGLAAPTLRAFSRPSSPHTSPLLSPMAFPHDEDEDDSLYPTHYAVRRDVPVPPISSVRAPMLADGSLHAEHGKNGSSQFLPAPGTWGADRQPWSWTRTFIFRGRRLRINLRVPGSLPFSWLKTLVGVGSNFGEIHGGNRRNIFVGTAIDGLAIAWPAAVVWIAIARWMF